MDPAFRHQLVEDFHTEGEVPAGTCMLSFRGSIAHNMFVGDVSPTAFDDVDLLGVVIGQPKHYLGLREWSHRGTKEIKNGRWDIVYYDLRKMVGLLLKGNPNVMSTLWLRDEDYLVKGEPWQLLIANRHMFNSKHVCRAFGAYAGDQLLKMTSRDPAELRDYMALTYEAKARGIHPNVKGVLYCYPENYDQQSGEARNAKAHSNDALLINLAKYTKKGENIGYMGDKRKQSILEHTFDCYDESATEFLTTKGWRKFDDIEADDTLFVVEPRLGVILCSAVLSRTDTTYSGKMYTIDAHGTRATITPNHNLLTSPTRRSPANDFSNEYKEEDADWTLNPIQQLLDDRRSHYHIRRAAELTLGAADDTMTQWLSLMGLFLSDGTLAFEKGMLRRLRLTQQPKNEDFCAAADRLLEWSRSLFNGGNKHVYNKETIWDFPIVPARKIFEWCGHSANKHLPQFCFGMTGADALILWNHLMLGDGTEKSSNDCYYSCSKKLADDIHAMMVSAGYYCTMYGPYDYDYSDRKDVIVYDVPPAYHVVLPSNHKRVACLNSGKILRAGESPRLPKEGFPIKESLVKDCRIVCLESEYGTLITRNSGKVAIQGNSKNAAHCVRLLRMAIEYKRTCTLTVLRPDAAELLDIKTGRAGLWPLERIQSHTKDLLAELDSIPTGLPDEPDYDGAEQLLVGILRKVCA